MSIAILGGTFDPIHLAHMRMAELAINEFGMDEVQFLPCKQPVLKPATHATEQQRVDMINLAIDGQTQYKLNRMELDRNTPSYMAETLASLRLAHPKDSISLLMGLDAFLSLPKWHDWQLLLNLAHILVVPRQGIDAEPSEHLKQLLSLHQSSNIDELKIETSGRIYIASELLPIISSTALRLAMSEGKDCSSMVPAPILPFIRQYDIYN